MLLFQRVRMQTEHTTECQPLKMASSCPSRKWLHPARHLLKNGCHGKRNVEDVFFSNLSALFVSGQQFSQFIQLVRAGLGVKGGGAYSCGHVPQWVLFRPRHAPRRRHTWVSFWACFNINLNLYCASFFYRCQYLYTFIQGASFKGEAKRRR